MKKQYRLINLDCANCAAKMEQEIARLPGVQSAAVNFMTAKLTLNGHSLLNKVSIHIWTARFHRRSAC